MKGLLPSHRRTLRVVVELRSVHALNLGNASLVLAALVNNADGVLVVLAFEGLKNFSTEHGVTRHGQCAPKRCAAWVSDRRPDRFWSAAGSATPRFLEPREPNPPA